MIKAIENNGKTELINIDKRGSNKHEIRVFNKRTYSKVKVRQCKYLNNIVEWDHRFISKRMVQCLGFKEFESAHLFQFWIINKGYDDGNHRNFFIGYIVLVEDSLEVIIH